MAFKMNRAKGAFPYGAGAGMMKNPDPSAFVKDDKFTSANPNAKDPQNSGSNNPANINKVTYAEAYKNRDMKTYGSLNRAEYTTEAKRQSKIYKQTGKWDYKNAPKVTEETKGNKTTRTVDAMDSKKVEVDKNRSNVVGDKKVTTTTNKVTGDTKKLKEKDASLLEGPKTKTTEKTKDAVTKTKVKSGKDQKLGTDDDIVKTKKRKKGGTGIGAKIKEVVARKKKKRADRKAKA